MQTMYMMHIHMTEFTCNDCDRTFKKNVAFGETESWTNVECPACGQTRPADHPDC